MFLREFLREFLRCFCGCFCGCFCEAFASVASGHVLFLRCFSVVSAWPFPPKQQRWFDRRCAETPAETSAETPAETNFDVCFCEFLRLFLRGQFSGIVSNIEFPFNFVSAPLFELASPLDKTQYMCVCVCVCVCVCLYVCRYLFVAA